MDLSLVRVTDTSGMTTGVKGKVLHQVLTDDELDDLYCTEGSYSYIGYDFKVEEVGEAKPIYADFNKLAGENKLVLTCAGTVRDLTEQKIDLHNGMSLVFWTDDEPSRLLVNGKAEWDEQGSQWLGVVDWDTLRHEGE